LWYKIAFLCVFQLAENEWLDADVTFLQRKTNETRDALAEKSLQEISLKLAAVQVTHVLRFANHAGQWC